MSYDEHAADVEHASDVDEHATIEMPDPDKGYRFAQVRDWIMLYPDLSATAYRMYSILFALATKQSRFQRRLTKDSLRWTMIGVNRKPMSKRTFDGALAELERHRLVVIEAKRTEQVRDVKGKYRRDESFRFKLLMLPEDEEGFEGYRSVMDKLDDYPGPGWDTATKNPTSSRAQNSADGADQASSPTGPEPVDNSRAQNSAHGADTCPTQNSADPLQNSASGGRSTRGNEDHRYSSSHTAFEGGETSVRPSSSADAHANDDEPDGRTDDPSTEQSDGWARVADELLGERTATHYAKELQVRASQHRQLRDALVSLMAETGDVDQVRGLLHDKMKTARTAHFVVEGLTTYREDIADVMPVKSPAAKQAAREQGEREQQARRQRHPDHWTPPAPARPVRIVASDDFDWSTVADEFRPSRFRDSQSA